VNVIGGRINVEVESRQDLAIPLALPRAPRIGMGRRRSGDRVVRVLVSGVIRLEEGPDLKS